jgi:membrane protease YdiL (CAAX protease family)
MLAMDLTSPSFTRRRVPAVVGALAAGGVILVLGNIPWGVLFALNQRLWPAIPWSVPPAILCLAGAWWYLLGSGPPAATRTWRSESLRAPRPTRATWGWALLAGAAGLTCVGALAWVATAVGAISPRATASAPTLPPATLTLFAVTNGLVTGVVEEAAFRGYMQVPLERVLGPGWAIAVVGIAFALSHLTHAWVGVAHLPFYFAASAVYSLLAMRAGSILPGLVLHAAGDGLLPLLGLLKDVGHAAAVAPQPGGAAVFGMLTLALVAAALSTWAFRHAGRVR